MDRIGRIDHAPGRTRARATLCVFLLGLIPAAFAAGQESRILTNASDGAFSADKRFWFSVPEEERLRIAVDGAETYRGPGPASVSLPLKPAEDREFVVVAERRSPPPEDALLESREFRVRMDGKVPLPPKVSAVQAEGTPVSWSLSFETEGDARVDVLLDDGEGLRSIRGAEGLLTVRSRRASGLAWSADAAGNRSAPVPFSYEPFAADLLNPAPGVWANPQRLVLASEGAGDLHWSDDGEDPFGPTGRSYEGPVLVERRGPVFLRVAARSPDGRTLERSVRYEVAPVSDDPPWAAALAAREADPVSEPAALAVPASSRWDIGWERGPSSEDLAVLPFAGAPDVTLRPVQGLSRVVPLVVSDGGVLRRYAFVLGAPAPSSAESAAEPAPAAGPLVAAGRARALYWARSEAVRFRFLPDGTWTSADEPVPVGPAGAAVEWFSEAPSAEASISTLTVPPYAEGPAFASGLPLAAPKRGGAGGRGVLLAAPLGAGLRFGLSAPGLSAGRELNVAPGAIVDLDVCDGEQATWLAAAPDGSASAAYFVDRRPPPAPRLDAPAEGAWLYAPPRISASSSEETGSGSGAGAGRVLLRVRWERDGASGEYELPNGGRLRSVLNASTRYVVSARAVDEAGNEGPEVSRGFSVDESAVYVGSGPAPRARDGSRDAPFADLADGLSAAAAGGRRIVHIAAAASLSRAIAIPSGIEILGGYDARFGERAGGSRISVGAPLSVALKGSGVRLSALVFVESVPRTGPAISVEGTGVELRDIELVPAPRSSVPHPALSAAPGSRLSARDCSFSGGAPAIAAKGAALSLVACLVSGAPPPRSGASLLSAVDSILRVEDSRFAQVGAGPGSATGIELSGGSSLFVKCTVALSSSESATGLSLRNVAFTADRLEVSASGGKYASGLSSSGGSVAWEGGSISSDAHDAVGAFIDSASPSRFAAARISVSGTGVVRGIHSLRDFPSVSGTRFEAAAPGGGAEALAGQMPAAGRFSGNSFAGFDFLFARSFDRDSIASFNRRFSPSGPPNEVSRLVQSR
jgi:hypothetical protein